MKPHHVNPEEAVQVHEDIRAKTSIGINWGTFRMTTEVSSKLNMIWPRGYKTFFMLNSGEHEILNAHKY